MISCFLQGGLGNQLFQIAATFALASKNSDSCAFDLHHGNFSHKPASVYRTIFYQKLSRINANNTAFHSTYEELSSGFREIPYKPGMLLKGYFQCERFFSDQRDAVYALFYNHDHTIRLKNKYKNILRSSISLHVRRGDYLAIPRYHPVPTADYYFTAIEKIKKTAKVDNILIFSDDHHWCEKTFNGHQFTFVKGLKDFEDLILMGLCDNHIIANSSFSWWGSWLGRNPNKIIIAPRIWVGPDAGRDWSDIYTDKMLIL